MPTTKHKAQQFIKEMDAALGIARAKHGIDPKDIDFIIRVDVEDKITYNYHEDED